MLTYDLSGSRPHFGRRQRRRIVYKQRLIFELGDRRTQLRPILFFEAPGSNSGLIYTANRRQHPHHQLVRGHFHTKNENWLIAIHQRIFDEVHRKRGFTH